MASKSYYDVWIKVVEAKGLKAADSNGLSDPYVTLTRTSEEGKKLGELKTPVVKKTLNPQWQTEFVIQVSAEPKVEEVKLRVYDWNRIAGNRLIGKAKLKFEFSEDEVQDIWVQLDTKGAVRMLVLRSGNRPPLGPLYRAPHRHLPNFHVRIERTHYFPGEVLRGALVFNLAKPIKKPHQLSILVEAVNFCKFRVSGELLPTSHYFLNHEVKNITVPGAKPGDPCPPGFHAIPFEVALPLTLPPTFGPDQFPYGHGNAFRVLAMLNVDGKISSEWTTFEIRPFPLSSDPRISPPNLELHHIDKNPYSEPKCITTASGPTQVAAGQTATYRCKMTNWTGKIIDYLEVRLVSKVDIFVRGSDGKWHSQVYSRDSVELKFVDGPGPDGKALQPPHGFPVAAGGGQWEGDITVEFPSDSDLFSVSPNVSPLASRSYYLEMRPKARAENKSEPAPKSETSDLLESERAPEPMILEVFPAPERVPPKPSPLTSNNTSYGIGPIYLYLEPFSGAQIADIQRLLKPSSISSVRFEYGPADLSPLFQRALSPSSSAKNSHWAIPSTEQPIPEEEWTPGNLPSWLK